MGGGGVAMQSNEFIQQLKWAIPGISWDIYTPQKERQKGEEDAAGELSALHHWHTAEGRKHKLGLQCFCSSLIKPNVCIFKAGFLLLFIFLFAVTANSTLPPSLPVDSAANTVLSSAFWLPLQHKFRFKSLFASTKQFVWKLVLIKLTMLH